MSLDTATYTVGISYILYVIYKTRDITKYVNLKEVLLFTRRYFYNFDPKELERSSLFKIQFYLLAEIFTFSL